MPEMSPENIDPMNPINVFVELRDEIFQHLTADDVKNASEVSKSWNEIVGSSSAAMKKINLTWNCDTPKLYGDRKYANLSIESSGKPEEATILIKFAATLVSLKFDNIEPGLVFPAVSLPILKTLEIGENVHVQSLSQFFENLGRTKIDKLTIKVPSGLTRFLKCNNQLKELTLALDFTIFYQPNDYICSNRLTKLRLGWLSFDCFFDNDMRANIIRLIQSQSATLTHFAVDEFDEDILRAALNINGLKTIECRISDMPVNSLPVNNSIEVVRFYPSGYSSNIQAFLALVPNTKFLYISKICAISHLIAIMKTSKHLRNIYTLWCTRINLLEICKNSDIALNRNIEMKVMKTFEGIFD